MVSVDLVSTLQQSRERVRRTRNLLELLRETQLLPFNLSEVKTNARQVSEPDKRAVGNPNNLGKVALGLLYGALHRIQFRQPFAHE